MLPLSGEPSNVQPEVNKTSCASHRYFLPIYIIVLTSLLVERDASDGSHCSEGASGTLFFISPLGCVFTSSASTKNLTSTSPPLSNCSLFTSCNFVIHQPATCTRSPLRSWMAPKHCTRTNSTMPLCGQFIACFFYDESGMRQAAGAVGTRTKVIEDPAVESA